MNSQDQLTEMGQRWLRGEEIVTGWVKPDGTQVTFNDKQKEFVNDKSRYCLISGGFASGKTTAFLVKLIYLSLWFPGNRILLGRKTLTDVETATLPDFFDLCPPGIFKHEVGAKKIKFFNGSEILFFGLDALQAGAGQDIKKAEQKIKSLNLGAFFIDQLEEIEERIIEGLSGRLRRNVGFQQGNMTTNPANFWAYDYFKANPRKNTKLIETSMIDNKDNLPEGFLEDQLSKPKMYVKRYVYGEWSPDSMVEGGVFSEEYTIAQGHLIKSPIRTLDGINIYHEPTNHEYQIGVDPSEGSVDPCSITVVDKNTGEVVATFSQYVPNQVQVEKTAQLAMMYSLQNKPLVVPEGVGAGQAFIESFKKVYDYIYEREVFSQKRQKKTKKLGFYTTHATKLQLIENMRELFQKGFPKIRDKATVEEMKTFIFTDEASQKGAGAQNGFHDDKIMSMMLAFYNVEPRLTDKIGEWTAPNYTVWDTQYS